MQSVKKVLGLTLLLAALLAAGCGGPAYPANEAGADANSGKEYTKDDSRTAQPQRGGSDKSDE